jgi:DNA polymerase-3 subunit alpha
MAVLFDKEPAIVGLEHLHVHTDFSTLDGYAQVEEYAERCPRNNMKYLCITDHGMMGVIPRQIRACDKAGIKPIFGCELYVNNTNVPREQIKFLPPEEKELASTSYHLLAIAYNNVGYSNLVQLTSWGWLNGFYKKPRVNHEQLIKHREGIIFTSCCYNSEVGKAFDRGGPEAADAMIEKYMAMFPGHYYLELMLLDFHKQKPYDAYIIRAHQKYGLPLIITNDCHYCNPEDSAQQRYMLMIRGNTTIKDIQMKVETGEDVFELQDTNLSFKSEKEINDKYKAMYWDVIPYELFNQAKLNTIEVCRKAEGVELDRSVKLPTIPDADQKLLAHLKQGLIKRGVYRNKAYLKRIQEEYELITRKGFASYFLIQKTMTDEARRVCPEILGWDAGDFAVGPGRGSAVGSLVCYCLGITNVDPVRHGLLFSRFLNEARGGRQMKTRFVSQPISEGVDDE